MRFETKSIVRTTAEVNALVLVAAGISAFVIRAAHNDNSFRHPEMYGVNSFTYNSSKNLGELTVSERFNTRTNDREAEVAMESILESSPDDLTAFFPSVPAAVAEGRFDCKTVYYHIDATAYNFDLTCTAQPTETGNKS